LYKQEAGCESVVVPEENMLPKASLRCVSRRAMDEQEEPPRPEPGKVKINRSKVKTKGSLNFSSQRIASGSIPRNFFH